MQSVGTARNSQLFILPKGQRRFKKQTKKPPVNCKKCLKRSELIFKKYFSASFSQNVFYKNEPRSTLDKLCD